VRRRHLVLAVALVATALLPSTAGAAEVPTFRTQRTYLHCADASVRLHNAAGATGRTIPWDTRPPAAAFLGSAAGCAVADAQSVVPFGQAAGVHAVTDLVAAGTFTGNVRAVTVHLHDLSHRADAGSTQQVLYVTLEVEGERVVDREPVTTTSVAENSGATHAVQLSITGLDLATEPGNGTTERDYRLFVDSQQGNVWAYDATEVPAGITFNPLVPAAARIQL
jgi:hypothetical protein